ncbi:MAG: Sec-independent protein translocase subunit TatA/TatB [Solirubrobacteraceae bacterium]
MFRSPAVDAIVIIVIVLLIMGPKRLPGIGKGLGQGMREFKEGITGESKSSDDDKPALSEAPAMPEAKPSSAEPAATSGSGTGSGAGSAGSERAS